MSSHVVSDGSEDLKVFARAQETPSFNHRGHITPMFLCELDIDCVKLNCIPFCADYTGCFVAVGPLQGF